MLTSSILIPQLIGVSKGLMTSPTAFLRTESQTRNLTLGDLNVKNSRFQLDSDGECGSDLELDWNLRLGLNETQFFARPLGNGHLHLQRHGHVYAFGTEPRPVTSRDLSGDTLRLRHWNEILEQGILHQLQAHARISNQPHFFGTKEINFLNPFNTPHHTVVHI